MYLIHDHLYANTANLSRILAEDAAAPELRHPVRPFLTCFHREKATRSRKKNGMCENETLCRQRAGFSGSISVAAMPLR